VKIPRSPFGRRLGALALAFSLAAFSLAGQAASAQSAHEAYYDYLGTYPSGAEPGYSNDFQGLTTDGVFWWLTQASAPCDPADDENSLWRVPVGLDLATLDASTPGVTTVTPGDSLLGAEGYWHLGDLAFYAHGAERYLVVAVERQSCFGFGCNRVIAVYDADSLALRGFFPVCGEQLQAPWCAVDPQGFVYSSSYYSTGGELDVHRYAIDWDQLDAGGPLSATHVAAIQLQDASGAPLKVERVQGGAISPSGELLYLCTMGEYEEGPLGCVVTYGGIQVFLRESDTGWRKIAGSTNGVGHFNFAFDPCEEVAGFAAPEEPEGIAIWDFDGKGVPGVTGQLHAIMLDNDAGADDVYLKHYTHRLPVGPGKKFASPADAVAYGWDGAEVRVDAGSYPGGVTIDKRLRLVPVGGPVVLGQ